MACHVTRNLETSVCVCAGMPTVAWASPEDLNAVPGDGGVWEREESQQGCDIILDLSFLLDFIVYHSVHPLETTFPTKELVFVIWKTVVIFRSPGPSLKLLCLQRKNLEATGVLLFTSENASTCVRILV